MTDPRAQRRARRRRRLVVAVVVTGALVWGVAVGATLLAAQGRAREALDRLELARDAATLAPDGPSADHLEAARDELTAARRHLSRPWLAPLRVAPVAGRQLESLDRLTAAARTTTDAALDALPVLHEAEGDLRAPGTRASVLRRIATVAETTRAALSDLDLGPDEGLVGPLADARQRFATELDAAVDGLERAAVVGRALAAVFDGSERYLLLAANNAEMRAGSGMFLMAGELVADGGRLSLSDPVSTADIPLDEPVPVDPDVARHWEWLSPGREWRNLAVTPRFDVTGEQAAAMWRAHSGRSVDGVLAVDVVAIAAMVSSLGPVEVDGVMLDGEGTRDELLHDQYVRAPNGGRTARHERLGTAARALVDRLDEGGWSPRSLAEALADPVEGRHVLAWSRDPIQQEGWKAAGIAGTLSERSVMVALLSRSGTKADPFVDVGVDVEMRRAGGEGVEVALEISVANRTPAGEPPYVAGPHPDTDLEAGEYAGILTVHVPGDATAPRFEAGVGVALRGEDGPALVAGTPLRLARGDATTITARFSMPDGAPIAVEPSARVPPVEWEAGGARWKDRQVRWLRPGRP